MMKSSSIHLLLLLLSLTAISLCHLSVCIQPGDVIPISHRVQFNEQRTKWSPMELSLNPRFALAKQTEINGIVPLLRAFFRQEDETQRQLDNVDLNQLLGSFGMSDSETVKIAFAIEKYDFLTPWLTVMRSTIEEEDKKKQSKTSETATVAHFLSRVDFEFKYTGDRILKVKHKVHYTSVNSNEPGAAIPETIQLSYHWEEVPAKDATAGLTLLYFSSFVGGLAVLVIIMRDFL